MSFITDTFFGGAEKKAAKAQEEGLERSQEFVQAGTEQARQDLFKLFPAAQQNVQQGFQGALDVFGQALPAQAQTFQAGNVAAQQQLLSGLPQFQNAILGGNIDFSQLQPTQLQRPDLGFFQQQLPQFTDPFEQERQRQAELEAIRAAAPQVETSVLQGQVQSAVQAAQAQAAQEAAARELRLTPFKDRF
jgi:hypothetical protein